MGKYKVVKMNTGFGTSNYTLMMNIGKGEFVGARPTRYYKTKKGALRAAIKKARL